jgi:hypothetical protein
VDLLTAHTFTIRLTKFFSITTDGSIQKFLLRLLAKFLKMPAFGQDEMPFSVIIMTVVTKNGYCSRVPCWLPRARLGLTLFSKYPKYGYGEVSSTLLPW